MELAVGIVIVVAAAVVAWRVLRLPPSPEEDDTDELAGLVAGNWKRFRR